MSVFKYYSPKCTLFGYECLTGLGDEIKTIGVKKGLIVTDKSLVELGIVAKVIETLDNSGIKHFIFDGVKPNPTVSNVKSGLQAQKDNNCDFLISVGGGSAHDCAKAICILATNGGEISDYKGMDKSTVMPLPLVAVNTTAGTASECTRAYVIVEEETNNKYGARDKNIIPAISVDDHALMMGLPKGLTAGTGMDALTHAVECYVSVNVFCLTASLALAAIKLVFSNLEEAVTASTEKSREGMAAGQYLAGLAFGNSGCGMVHSMSHQLSAVYDLPHGLCNAILLPEVLKFNCGSEVAMVQLAALADDIFTAECRELSTPQKAELFIKKVEKLSDAIGTSKGLASLGVKPEDIPVLAEKALLDGSLGNNPVKPTKEQVMSIYKILL